MSREGSPTGGSAIGPERLVAYLDGELPPEESVSVSDWLRREPSARTEAEELRRVWDLLDELPAPTSSEDLGGRTIEAARPGWVDARRVAVSWMVFLAVLTIVAIGARGWAARNAPAEERPVHAESSALEFEALRAVGTWEFLQALERSGAFAEDDP
jgi:anti-sigma factor RsiW